MRGRRRGAAAEGPPRGRRRGAATVLLQQYCCKSTVATVLLQQYCCNNTGSRLVRVDRAGSGWAAPGLGGSRRFPVGRAGWVAAGGSRPTPATHPTERNENAT